MSESVIICKEYLVDLEKMMNEVKNNPTYLYIPQGRPFIEGDRLWEKRWCQVYKKYQRSNFE